MTVSMAGGQIEHTTSDRIYYLDNLRALAMFLGVILHVAMPYTEHLNQIWFAAETKQSFVFDLFVVFVHLFRMGLFFLVAGFFAHLLLAKRGAKGFAWHRVKRLGFVFLVFYPIAMVAIIGLIFWSVDYAKYTNATLDFFRQSMQQPGDDAGPMNTFHLWFLYHLFFYCMVAALVYRYGSAKLGGYLQSLLMQPWVWLLLPLLLVPAAMSVTTPMPAPGSFVLEWWGVAYYLPLFFIGYLMFKQQGILDRLDAWRWPMVFVCALMFVPYYLGLKPIIELDLAYQVVIDRHHMVMVLLQCYQTLYLIVLALLFGRRWLNLANDTLRFLSNSSYWVYLLHLPVAIAIQIYLANLDWPVASKFAVALSVTLVVCLISYQWLVRRSFIGVFLNGRKQ